MNVIKGKKEKNDKKGLTRSCSNSSNECLELKKEMSFNKPCSSNQNSFNLSKKFEQPLTPSKRISASTAVITAAIDITTNNSNKNNDDENINVSSSSKDTFKEKTNNKGGYEGFLNDLKEAINTLNIYKLVLPNSTTNKNLLQKLEYLKNHLNFIKKEDFFYVKLY